MLMFICLAVFVSRLYLAECLIKANLFFVTYKCGQAALVREYEADTTHNIQIHNPR